MHVYVSSYRIAKILVVTTLMGAMDQTWHFHTYAIYSLLYTILSSFHEWNMYKNVTSGPSYMGYGSTFPGSNFILILPHILNYCNTRRKTEFYPMIPSKILFYSFIRKKHLYATPNMIFIVKRSGHLNFAYLFWQNWSALPQVLRKRSTLIKASWTASYGSCDDHTLLRHPPPK